MNDQILSTCVEPENINGMSNIARKSVTAREKILACSLVIALWSLFSLPPMLLSQWFPLDLHGIFTMGENLRGNFSWIISPYNGSGRYFPFYWIFNSIQYLLFGQSIALYYLVQSLIFFGSVYFTSSVFYKIAGNFRLSILLFFIIYFGSPIAENISTLGKAEPLSYFFIILILLYFCRWRNDRRNFTFLHGVTISIIFSFALWTKETSLVLLGFALTALSITVILRKINFINASVAPTKSYIFLLGALLGGLAFAKIPYLIFPAAVSTKAYTDYDITIELIQENLLFYISQQPDVVIFGILSIIFIIIWAWKLFYKNEILNSLSLHNFIFVSSLCVMAWAYYLALLVWRWPMPYYMLLPSIIFKLCLLGSLYYVTKIITFKKIINFIVFWLIGLALFYAALCEFYVISSQIAYSRMYTEAIKKYRKISLGKSSLVMESYPFFAEQVGEGKFFISGYSAGTAKGIADLLDPAVLNPKMLQLLKITQEQLDKNIESLPKKGDYLLAFTGNKLATWFLRGVTPYYNEDSLLKKQGVYEMKLVAENKIETPAIYINTWTHRVEFESTSIGYKLYRVLEDKPKFFWKGRYPDGWIGKSASLLLNSSYTRVARVKLSAPYFTLPNKVIITKNGKFFKELKFTDTNEVEVDLGEPPFKNDVIKFEVEKTAVPKEIKLNSDVRKLGIRISLDMASNVAK